MTGTDRFLVESKCLVQENRKVVLERGARRFLDRCALHDELFDTRLSALVGGLVLWFNGHFKEKKSGFTITKRSYTITRDFIRDNYIAALRLGKLG
jgi:hypothetical protein